MQYLIAIIVICLAMPEHSFAHPDYDRLVIEVRDSSGKIHYLRTRCGDGIFFADPCWPSVDASDYRNLDNPDSPECTDIVFSLKGNHEGWAFCSDAIRLPGSMFTWKLSDWRLRPAERFHSIRMWAIGAIHWPRSFAFAVFCGVIAMCRNTRTMLRVTALTGFFAAASLFLNLLYGFVPAWLLVQGFLAAVALALLRLLARKPLAQNR